MKNHWRLFVQIVILMLTLYSWTLLIKSKKYLRNEIDNNTLVNLDNVHYEYLYPSRIKQTKEEKEFRFSKQKGIGICVNFNNDPDVEGHTINSLINFYSQIHEYILLLTPSPLENLSLKNVQLLKKFDFKSIEIKNRTIINSKSDFNGLNSHYHLQCLDGRSGQLQHKCLLVCAQLYQYLKKENSNLRGILYLADDLYLNFAYVLTHPERFPLDEIWTTPSTQYFDFNQENSSSSYFHKWWWWKNRPHFWQSFKFFFLSKLKTHKQFENIFEILYGKKKCLSIANADLLYLPFSDNQLTNWINITYQLMEHFPSDIFCEIIYSLIVDLTMSISEHWPYQHDQLLFNSSINRLNHLKIIKQMERNNRIKSPRDPYSLNKSYLQRPSIFNPDGFIWDHHRNNQQLYSNAIFNQTFPFHQSSKSSNANIEFVHPLKLSNPHSWQVDLWNKATQLQIQQIKFYQLYKKKV